MHINEFLQTLNEPCKFYIQTNKLLYQQLSKCNTFSTTQVDYIHTPIKLKPDNRGNQYNINIIIINKTANIQYSPVVMRFKPRDYINENNHRIGPRKKSTIR